MFSIRNGITFLVIGGVIMILDLGFRSNTTEITWLEYDLGFVRFSAWIAGLVVAALGLLFLLGGIIRRRNSRYSH